MGNSIDEIKEVCCKKYLDIVVNGLTIFKFERGECYPVSESDGVTVIVTIDFMNFAFDINYHNKDIADSLNTRFLYDNFYTVNEQRKRKINLILR